MLSVSPRFMALLVLPVYYYYMTGRKKRAQLEAKRGIQSGEQPDEQPASVESNHDV